MALFDTKGGATVTATQDNSGSFGEDHIDSLLTADLQNNGNGDGATGAAEDTSVAGATETPEQEETERVDTTGDEVSDEETADAGNAGEFDESALSEQDRDFSASAYEKAAKHYSKQAGRDLDPDDPGDRWMLREMMIRGQKIKELQSAEATEEEETEEPKVDETRQAGTEPHKPTTQEIMEAVGRARQQAKSQIVPEVAMEFAKNFLGAMWPGKKIDFSQEQANALAETFGTFAIMQIADVLPVIFENVPQAVVNRDPMMARVRDMAVRESAVDEILGTMNKGGQPAFPDFERLVDSGAIKRAMQSEDLKDAVFNKDPYKNLVAKLKMAYKLAKNQPVDVATLEQATARGREQAEERARRVAAGRTPPGSSRSGTGAPGGPAGLKRDILSGGGSKFSRAIAEAVSRRQ
jgi:hypothetical protein